MLEFIYLLSIFVIVFFSWKRINPEIPIDIVSLGLIYGVDFEDGTVHIKMTMTAPGCPSSAEITAESKMPIEELPGVKSATIEIVWDPPWDPSRMSEEAKQSMGM